MSLWPHSPPHRVLEPGTYMVTGATISRTRIFNDVAKLDQLTSTLLATAEEFQWHLEAWSVFSNHYHFIAWSEQPRPNLCTMISKLHTLTAKSANVTDGVLGRRVWFQYWDSQLTYEKSYLARLNYVHENPVHHGLVVRSQDYRWCSSAWFDQHAPESFRSTVRNFKTDRLKVRDDF